MTKLTDKQVNLSSFYRLSGREEDWKKPLDQRNLDTIFECIVRTAQQQGKGDYLPAKIHEVLGELEQRAEDYIQKWRERQALEKLEQQEE